MSEKLIQAAILRLPAQSSAAIRQVRENALMRSAPDLLAACDRELALRGSGNLTAEEARRALEHAASVQDSSLREVIEAAFTALPARDYEIRLLRVIAENPGATYGTDTVRAQAAHAKKPTRRSALSRSRAQEI